MIQNKDQIIDKIEEIKIRLSTRLKKMISNSSSCNSWTFSEN